MVRMMSVVWLRDKRSTTSLTSIFGLYVDVVALVRKLRLKSCGDEEKAELLVLKVC